MELSTARALLSRKDSPGGDSVLGHLTSLLSTLLVEQPPDGLRVLEAVSARVKAGALGDGELSGGTAAGAAGRPRCAALSASRRAVLASLCAAPTTGAGEPEEGGGEPPLARVQELALEAPLLEWGGLSLGAGGMFRMQLALRALARSRPRALRALRYWGTLLGTRGDYLVAEGSLQAGEVTEEVGGEEPGAPSLDAAGLALQVLGAPGPNDKAYWVCSALGEAWTALPRLVSPQQISRARCLRRLLTGELAAPVGGHPAFPGSEAHLLRATIALINAAAAIAPAGAFQLLPAEDPGAEEGGIMPATEEDWLVTDLTDTSNWVHTSLALNAHGRTRASAVDPEAPATSAPSPGGEPPEDAAPPQPLRPASSDEWPPAAPAFSGEGARDDYASAGGCAPSGGAWDVRRLPSADPRDGAPAGPPAILALHSRAYPGAVAVAAGRRWAWAYTGWGLPAAPAGSAGAAPYQPTLPPPPRVEYDYSGATDGQQLTEEADITVDPTPAQVAGEEVADEE